MVWKPVTEVYESRFTCYHGGMNTSPQAPDAHRQYLFGPVASRRLGRSLGVDMVPAKVCSLDCVYCESGLTTCATLERRAYVSTEAVLRELADYLHDRPPIDIITFSGAGEPTLHKDIGKVIEFIKQHYPCYRVAVLTNATLLPDPAVRHELQSIDLLMPSLDAADDAVMERMNRPVAGLTAASMIDGLAAFRSESKAEMWLEIFIVPGINDKADHLSLLRQAIERIAPDRVQLNTLDRPGPEPWVKPAARAELERIAAMWQPLPVEIIARNPRPDNGGEQLAADPSSGLMERIIGLVRRRPATDMDMVTGLGLPLEMIESALKTLREKEILVEDQGEHGIFYRLRR